MDYMIGVITQWLLFANTITNAHKMPPMSHMMRTHPPGGTHLGVIHFPMLSSATGASDSADGKWNANSDRNPHFSLSKL